MGNEKPGSLAENLTLRSNRSALGLSLNRLLTLAIFVIMFTIFSIFANNFFTVRGVLNLLVQTSTFTILGIGATFVLVVGCVDFSLGSVIALSGTAVYVFAALGIPIWIAAIAASLLGGVVGLANGFLVARVRLPSFLITFTMGMIVYGLLAAFGAYMAVHAGPPPQTTSMAHLGDLANSHVLRIISHGVNGEEIVVFPGISWIVIIMVVVAVLSHLFLVKTRFGRYLFLVGSNPEASHFSGIKVFRVKILAFVFGSVMAGLVGVLLTSRLGVPSGAAAGYEMIAIECAMIGGATLSGGTGSVGGTVIGSFLIATIAMGIAMVNVNQIYIPMLINGLILLVAVYLDQKRKMK
jgi:ribose transport system permease protein